MEISDERAKRLAELLDECWDYVDIEEIRSRIENQIEQSGPGVVILRKEETDD